MIGTIQSQEVIDIIDPVKDVDGCTTFNKELLSDSDIASLSLVHVPCAAMAMFHFLQSYHIPTNCRQAVVVGRSELVGIPCLSLLQKAGCSCSVIEKSTPHPQSIARTGDVLVTAVGHPGLITREWLKEGSTVIDIGTTCVKNARGKCKREWC